MEESAKANEALFSLFPLMAGAMLLLLMWQLRHFGRVALVLATAALGIPGAAAALLLTGQPFGFVALLGVIALAGMVMRNTLTLVDQMRQDLDAGAELREAIVESAVRRARPVLLTALAAVLAFVPLTLSVFWGPMTVAMIGGLTLATFATLLVAPALYALALPRRSRRTVSSRPLVTARNGPLTPCRQHRNVVSANCSHSALRFPRRFRAGAEGEPDGGTERPGSPRLHRAAPPGGGQGK